MHFRYDFFLLRLKYFLARRSSEVRGREGKGAMKKFWLKVWRKDSRRRDLWSWEAICWSEWRLSEGSGLLLVSCVDCAKLRVRLSLGNLSQRVLSSSRYSISFLSIAIFEVLFWLDLDVWVRVVLFLRLTISMRQ